MNYTIEKNKNYTVVSLQNQLHQVKIAPELGSNMFSWTYGQDEIIIFDRETLEKRGFTGNFVLFPTPNRVKDFTYSWKGRQIPLVKHGKLVDIHHQLVYDEPWHFETPVVQDEHVSITTWIDITKDSPLFDGFPFPCRLSLTYELSEKGVTIRYAVKNNGSEELPFGFGLHPYFHKTKNTLIQIPARKVMESTEDHFPTGKLLDVTGQYDLRTPVALSKLNLDDVFTDLIPGQDAFIQYEKYRVILKASEDFTHMVVYTGETNAVCIENQTCSTDALNLHAQGFTKEAHVLTVEAGQTHHGFISYTVVT